MQFQLTAVQNPRALPRPALVVPLFLLAQVAIGAPPRVEVAFTDTKSTVVEGAPITIHAQLNISGGTTESSREITVDAQGRQTILDLAPGSWSLWAKAAGYWGPREVIEVSTAAAAVDPVVLRLWRTGILSGTVGEDGPPVIQLVFESSPAAKLARPARAVPTSTNDCPVRDRRWSCEVPAELLDIQLRAKRFVPRYLWDVRIDPGAHVDLKQLPLRRGASVAGWVSTPPGTSLTPGCRVALTAPDGEKIGIGRNPASVSLSAAVNERGFFQMAPVPAGHYVISARRRNMVTEAVPIQVLGEHESLLVRPLGLSRPARLDVVVDPPRDPSGRSWMVELLSRQGAQRTSTERQSTVPISGEVRFSDLPQVEYFLVVRSAGGDRWLVQPIRLNSEQERVDVALPVLRVGGTVKLGSAPLAATVFFGGAHGPVRISVRSDEAGQFAADLPENAAEGGLWTLDIQSDDPPVRRTIEGVSLRPTADKESLLDIELPDTRLQGKVVDVNERPMSAVVAVQSLLDLGQLAQILTDEQGHFASRGLAPGGYLVSAEGASGIGIGGAQSDQVLVTLTDDEASMPLRLVVRDMIKATVTVVSSEGPIPGARVKCYPVQAPVNLSRVLSTDAEGRAEFWLPAGTREVGLTAHARGYGFRIARLPVAPGGEVVVALSNSAGRLNLRLPDDAGGVRTPREGGAIRAPVLVHGGFFDSVPYLRAWAATNQLGAQAEGELMIPSMEPGPYALCHAEPADFTALIGGQLPKGRCVTDILQAGGEISLTLPVRTNPASTATPP